MNINYFDLSGGIKQSSTKTDLGLNPKKIYWADSENIEIYNNRGINKQRGNSLLFKLPQDESITGLCELVSDNAFKLVVTTSLGNIYIYSKLENSLTLLDKKITGKNIKFAKFLQGVIVATESDEMFYIKDNSSFDVEDCNLIGRGGDVIYPNFVTIYKGRVWCSEGSTIYYSALGTYNDFETSEDAGYINDFHTDTSDIISMCTYKDYLAIYKRDKVYLLSGSNPSDFTISLFADKGVVAPRTIINVDNRQYFLSNGIYALEQVGELNQIRLGSEFSQNIKSEFEKFDYQRISKSFVVHYQLKHQVWYFIPYLHNEYYHTVWINDYVNNAWFKRVIPQKITCSVLFDSHIITSDTLGNVYIEDYGTTFNGEPIKFLWKSPFLSLGNVHRRKLVDEFYFVLDDVSDNRFQFSLYKDYDSEYQDDKDLIYSQHYNHFIWAGDDTPDNIQYCWSEDGVNSPVWAISSDIMEKAEICGSNYSIQLCVEGSEITDDCTIIGLQFREIYSDE